MAGLSSRGSGGTPENEQPWMYFYDDGWFGMQRGMAELALCDGPRAVRFLDRGPATLPEAYRRDHAWFGTRLARAHALAGDVEAAERFTTAAVPDALAVNRYAVRDLRKLSGALHPIRSQNGKSIEEALRAAER